MPEKTISCAGRGVDVETEGDENFRRTRASGNIIPDAEKNIEVLKEEEMGVFFLVNPRPGSEEYQIIGFSRFDKAFYKD